MHEFETLTGALPIAALTLSGTVFGPLASCTLDQRLGPYIALATAAHNLCLWPIRPRVPFGG